MKITKRSDLIKDFQENPPTNSISFNASRFLFRKVSQFINSTMKNRPRKQGLANVYRHLVRYSVEINNKIIEVENELIETMKENETVYIPDGREKIIKKGGELYLSDMSDSNAEWKKAYKQMEKMNEEIEGGIRS